MARLIPVASLLGLAWVLCASNSFQQTRRWGAAFCTSSVGLHQVRAPSARLDQTWKLSTEHRILRKSGGDEAGTVTVQASDLSKPSSRSSGKQQAGLDFNDLSSQARQMSKEAGDLAAKGGKDAAAERAKELAFGAAATGLDAASDAAPPWLFTTVAAGVLLFTAISAVSGQGSRAAPPPAPAQVVQVSQPTASQVFTGDFAETAKEPSLTSKLAPSAASAPRVAAQAAPAQALGKTGTSAANELTSTLANGLRVVADNLPKAEQALEQGETSAEAALRWAGELKADNAAEKVAEDAVPLAGQIAAQAAKFALKAGSSALDFAAQNLPAAGEALESATMKLMPAVQEGSREAAGALRDLAKQAAVDAQQKQGTGLDEAFIRSSPDLLAGAASGLDSLADLLPEAERIAAYGGKTITPLLQAGLRATSEVAKDAADIPLPSMGDAEKKQLATTLKGLSSEFVQKSSELAEKAKSATSKP